MLQRKTAWAIQIALMLIFSACLSAQTPPQTISQLPRDADKLVVRAQAFWSTLVAGQRTKSLEFVLPEKRDAFLTGNPMPILRAKVVGLNLGTSALKASLRVEVQTPEATALASWILTDSWIWKGNNWYVDVGDPKDWISISGGKAPGDAAKMQGDIDRSIRLVQSSFSTGTLIKGKNLKFQIPIEYSGQWPLSVDLAVPYPSFTIDTAPSGLTAASRSFGLTFDTESWDGPFSIPLRLRFSHEAAVVERILNFTGEVFAPISFRQMPPDSASPEGILTVFITNHTAQEIRLQYLSVDGTMDIVKTARSLVPNQEVEVSFKMRPGQKPDVLYVVPQNQVEGLGQFTYRFRIGK